jgi:hypothetical protein
MRPVARFGSGKISDTFSSIAFLIVLSILESKNSLISSSLKLVFFLVSGPKLANLLNLFPLVQCPSYRSRKSSNGDRIQTEEEHRVARRDLPDFDGLRSSDRNFRKRANDPINYTKLLDQLI